MLRYSSYPLHHPFTKKPEKEAVGAFVQILTNEVTRSAATDNVHGKEQHCNGVTRVTINLNSTRLCS